MKKTLVLLLCMVGMFSFAPRLYAADCQGSSAAVYCTSNQKILIINSANENCCAGSVIILENCNNGFFKIHEVTEDGPNSSCAPN